MAQQRQPAWFSGLALSSLLLALPLGLANPVRAEQYTVGVLYWSENIPCQVEMRRGLEQTAADIGETGPHQYQLVPMLAGDGHDGIERQIDQMRNLVSQNVDAIIVQPTDNAALSGPLLEANKAGIPVIAYDQYISRGELVSYVTSDNYQAGYYNGEFIADRFKTSTSAIRLVLVEYPHVSSTVERLNGFLDALEDYQQAFTILKTYEAVEPESGREAGAAILRDFPEPDSIDVVFTVNDGGGLSVVDALATAGRNEIVVATIDGDPASIDNISEQRLTHIDTAQFCGPMGAMAMRMTSLHLAGNTVAKHILLPVYPITRETLAAYPGWAGPIPDTFTKPWFSHEPQWHHQIKTVN